jgi:hypothetical protein
MLYSQSKVAWLHILDLGDMEMGYAYAKGDNDGKFIPGDAATLYAIELALRTSKAIVLPMTDGTYHVFSRTPMNASGIARSVGHLIASTEAITFKQLQLGNNPVLQYVDILLSGTPTFEQQRAISMI